MIIENYSMRSSEPIPAGKHEIEVATAIKGPGQAGTVTLSLDGQEIGSVALKRTVPAAFSATESFDVGVDLGSPVSSTYEDKRPFEFDGTINSVKVTLK